MYCPNCKKKFTEDLRVCPDCNMKLTSELIKENNLICENIDPVKVSSAANDIEAQILLNLLANNNIPCFKKNNGAGGYMNVYMGYSVFGEDIYVDKRDYQAATDLLNSLQPDTNSMDLEDDLEDYKIPFYKNPRIIARIMAAIIGLYLIVTGIIGILT